MISAKKDAQTVTPAGERVAPIIEGVSVRYAVTQPDERGSITEVFDPRWAISPDALVYLYEFTIRPGIIKGWIKHFHQTDRVFLQQGAVRFVLYDDRPDSPTYQMINQFTLTEQNRGMLLYPSGVFHALENVGSTDALLLNMPTRPYNHQDPDKYRIPLVNDQIPFKFSNPKGW